MLESLPVFGICGWSGSGKTTLIEQLLPELLARGLRVAIVKHDAHGLDVDREGKDSDRFFKAGADVLVRGPDQMFFHAHNPSCLETVCASLARSYDLILVEGHKGTPLPKVWLLGGRKDNGPPPEVTEMKASLPRDADASGAARGRVSEVTTILMKWLAKKWLETPVYACVVVDPDAAGDGPNDIENILSSLSGMVERTVVIGRRATSAGTCDCLPPAPDADDKSLAGLLAAMRWQPHVSWIVVKQTAPEPPEDEFRQLLAARRPGAWAATSESRGLLYVDFRSGATVEALATKNAARSSDFHNAAAETITRALASGMEEVHHAGNDNRNSGRS
jgi:molybdopterin-guanine dinucleotide biosynthesis protein B